MNTESNEEFKKRLEWEEFTQAASKRDFEEQERLKRPFLEKLVPIIFTVGLWFVIGIPLLLGFLYFLSQLFISHLGIGV